MVGGSPRGDFEFAASSWLSQAARSPTAPKSLPPRWGVDFPGFESLSFPAMLSLSLLSSQQPHGRACSPSAWPMLASSGGCTVVAEMLRLIQRVHNCTVKPPPVPPEHIAEFSWAVGSLGEVSLWVRPMQSLSKWIRAVVQPVFLTHPNFPRGLLSPIAMGMMSSGSWCFGVCSPALWAVFIQPGRATLPGCVISGEQMCCPLLSYSRSVPMSFHAPLRWGHPTQSRCKLQPRAQGASSLPVLPTGAGPGGAGWPAQGAALGQRRLPPVYHPRVWVQQRCSDPSAHRAVAMEIACAVARQLKHLRLHTAMPRNSQLSSIPISCLWFRRYDSFGSYPASFNCCNLTL